MKKIAYRRYTNYCYNASYYHFQFLFSFQYLNTIKRINSSQYYSQNIKILPPHLHPSKNSRLMSSMFIPQNKFLLRTICPADLIEIHKYSLMSQSTNKYLTSQNLPPPGTIDWSTRLFAEDYQELVNTFNIFDEDGSGVIDPVEISAALNQLGPYHVNPFILELINGLMEIQEPITLDVFINWIVSQVGDLKSRDGIQKVFARYDSNCNNFVSNVEFKAVARSIHDCISEAEIDEMIQAVFVNWGTSSNQGLVFDQFYQVVANFVPQ